LTMVRSSATTRSPTSITVIRCPITHIDKVGWRFWEAGSSGVLTCTAEDVCYETIDAFCFWLLMLCKDMGESGLHLA
jgi:hypothetical protein